MASVPIDPASIDPELLERGNVWRVRFDPTEGHEQGAIRPAVIVSASPFNTPGRALVAVAPITSQLRTHRLHVRVAPPEGGLERESEVLCEQVRTLGIHRLLEHRGILLPSTMRVVDIRLRVYLNL